MVFPPLKLKHKTSVSLASEKDNYSRNAKRNKYVNSCFNSQSPSLNNRLQRTLAESIKFN